MTLAGEHGPGEAGSERGSEHVVAGGGEGASRSPGDSLGAGQAPLLDVSALQVSLPAEEGMVEALSGIDLTLAAGQTLGIVGESGAGKSVAALAIMGLLGDRRARVRGSVRLAGRDLLTLGERGMRAVRGREIAMIFQDPLSALHPLKSVGSQVAEAVRAHRTLSRRAAHRRAVELLERVGIGDPARRARQYPHELSGGMRQRVMIAIALANEPRLLIADEPTTALDVTVQAQILDLLRDLQAELSMALILITHDLGVVAELAGEVAVMYAGRIVERAPAEQLFDRPEHPYTWGLIGSMPTLHGPRAERLEAISGAPPSPLDLPSGCRFHPRCPHALPECSQSEPALVALGDERAHEVACVLEPQLRRELWRAGPQRARGSPAAVPGPAPAVAAEPAEPAERAGPAAGAHGELVEVRGLVKHFPITRGILLQRSLGSVHAVDGISFGIRRGEAFGIVGESGCGKSTTARLLMRLLDPSGGSIAFDGQEIVPLHGRALKALRRRIQMVFQDPYSSLNPRRTAGAAVGEPLAVHRIATEPGERRRRVLELLGTVGLGPESYNRYPHELSGGMRQRVGIARALALEPDLLIADEPVSAVDVSTQAQILNLLADARRNLGLSVVLISHDLAVVRHMCDRVGVMYLGKLVEVAPADSLYGHPRHPYTAALLASVPQLGRAPGGAARRAPGERAGPGRTGGAAEAGGRAPLRGEVPSAAHPPSGCRFHPRCPKATERCAREEPVLAAGPGAAVPGAAGPAAGGLAESLVACHYPLEMEEVRAMGIGSAP